MSFSVTVQLEGGNTCGINGLKSTDTIADLVQKLVDKEGLERSTISSLHFRSKNVLVDTSKQLRDVGITARSFLSVAFRVQGGMAQELAASNVRRFNEKEAAKYGIRVTNNNCGIFCSEGCGDSSVAKLTFTQCNNEKHAYCADCMYTILEKSIFKKRNTYIQCAMGCEVKFDFNAAFFAAGLTDDEVVKFEKQLNKNCFVMCPNDKCKAYFLKDSVNTNKVQCSKCKGAWFCKVCRRDWPANSNDYMMCGYDDCSTTTKIVENCTLKDYTDYGTEKNVPSLRKCKSCKSNVEWVNRCKHSTCPICKYKFCFVCLKEGHGCPLGTPCKVAK